ncbi:MAG: phytanoyl-CoA dioxygenase family protein [Thermoanaerobaculia bacterium]|nr:phytanoyl-CoA dioxygenase family protein [Thermoanaerobaculia bacterium]
MNSDLKTLYAEQGFALVDDVVSPAKVDELRREVDQLLEHGDARGGVRHLLRRSHCLRIESMEGPVPALARSIVGPKAVATKLTLFTKTTKANWLVAWHQDLNITVRHRLEVPGFTAWSTKEGVVHVRPPVEVLEGVLAIRLHLDDTPADNGALRVLPGSHLHGRLSNDKIDRFRRETPETVCEVSVGGAMLMSPLLLHASSKASSPTQRRVLHFEYSASSLPSGLEWVDG